MNPSSGAASARSAASRLHDNRASRFAARVGFAINGLIHLLIGGIALSVAFGSGGEADHSGALRQLSATPAGGVMLWAITVGLIALGLYQVVETVLVRGTDKNAWADRAKEGGKAVAYLAIGISAASFAVGSGSDSSGQTQSLTATLMSTPGGVFLVALVGLSIITVGVFFIIRGVKKTFLNDITTPTGKTGRGVLTVGRVGYIAKGIAIGVLGILFCIAAATSDPSEATGLDGALKTLTELPYGWAILTVIAVGLIAYGIYFFVRAKYARL